MKPSILTLLFLGGAVLFAGCYAAVGFTYSLSISGHITVWHIISALWVVTGLCYLLASWLDRAFTFGSGSLTYVES
jgi:hypothetical protein